MKKQTKKSAKKATVKTYVSVKKAKRSQNARFPKKIQKKISKNPVKEFIKEEKLSLPNKKTVQITKSAIKNPVREFIKEEKIEKKHPKKDAKKEEKPKLEKIKTKDPEQKIESVTTEIKKEEPKKEKKLKEIKKETKKEEPVEKPKPIIKIDPINLRKVSLEDNWRKVEAVLFASGKYVSEEKIAALTKLPVEIARASLESIKQKYAESDSSLELFQEGNTWKLNVKEEYTPVIKEVVSEAELPAPILETLAMIAYKTPVAQSEIVDARGTGAYEHIGILEQKGFITREKMGRSFKIRVGEKFFDYFDVPDESKIQEVFKDVQKPEMINLATYNDEQREEKIQFADKLTERLQKIPETREDLEKRDDFLDNFEKKINDAKLRIDETEKEITQFKRTEQNDISAEQKTWQEDEVKTPETNDEKKKFLEKIDHDIDEIAEDDEDKNESDNTDN